MSYTVVFIPAWNEEDNLPSVLDTLQEESSPIEPNRKSYVSFADSGSDTAALSITDPDGNVVRHSYFDESTTGSGGSGSMRPRLRSSPQFAAARPHVLHVPSGPITPTHAPSGHSSR